MRRIKQGPFVLALGALVGACMATMPVATAPGRIGSFCGAGSDIACAAPCMAAVPGKRAPHRPNILLITSEDNGAHLGCYGDPHVRTPHLDELAGEGVRFANAYVTQAGCSQSRASIFTGLYPHQNGQIGLATHGLRMYRGDTPNIFSELKRAGYTTGIIGKIHVNPESAFPLDYHDRLGGFSHRDVAKEAQRARTFMRKAEGPFLLMVNYKDAHRPFIQQQKGRPLRPLEPADIDVLPQAGLDTPNLRKQTADYYNCMMRLDDGIGMLMKAVNDAGKWENTLIVYLGDHGADILRGKRTSYEGGVKIPLIASWPGRIKGGQVRDELVSTIDLMPTFLELAGVAGRPGLPGRSLAPLLRGDSPAWRTHLFTEYHLHSGHNYYPQRTVRDGRYKLIHNLLAGELNPGYAFTNDRFFEEGEIEGVLDKAPPHVRAAYARLRIAPPYELYDLENDPWEFHDLAADPAYGDILKGLKDELATWRKRTKDPLLDPANLSRLTDEVAARWKGGSYRKNMQWNYPEYFHAAPRRLNVLFIAVDDMNDWTTVFDKDHPIKTPHLERLAKRGTFFTRAYCVSAACNPSRAATLTGLRPATSGVYGNKSDWRGAMPERRTIMQRFMDAGYDVRGAGKIFHHHWNGAFHDEASFHEFQHMRQQKYPPEKLNAAPRYGSRNTDWGAWPPREEESIDFHTAEYCIKELSRPRGGKPLFLACGIFKPHSPFFAPAACHAAYRAIDLPPRRDDDWDDLPAGAADLLRDTKWFWRGMMELEEKQPGSYREFIRSYAACTAFADAQIGRVLDALDRSGRRDNTIVVLWSDHGFHLGEKDHIEKFALWEKTNHIPFVVAAPGVTTPGTRCARPVDLSVLYPTLLELCGLPADPQCDGRSVVPLLRDPKAAWDRPAVMTYGYKNHAVRSERWRYIRYADGSEELYDHHQDPHEWTNLASNPDHRETMDRLGKWLPGTNARPCAGLKNPGSTRR